MIKSNSIENRCISILLLFYFFDILGICIPATSNFFITLTPLNLFITLAIFYKVNKDYRPRFLKLGFGSWKNDIIPLQNYAKWFLISIFMHGIIYLFKPRINAKISFIIIGVSALFFGFLNILL